MTGALDPVALCRRLIACPSVTPADGGAMAVAAAALEDIGFTVHRMTNGEAPDGPIENLYAERRRGTGPHLAFAGHTDVVPPGAGWTGDPFGAEVRDGLLFGRGAVDMKGAIAAFIAAAAVTDAPGTLSLILTGDEEGAATYGTVSIMEWMAARAIRPDMILVGEPTSAHALGDMMKIGRRGSVNLWVEVAGAQGHVAYPHLADNPLPRLVAALAALEAWTIDAGDAWFQPSNLEITDIAVGNAAHNVIPARAEARLNIRFNAQQTGAGLVEQVCAIVAAAAPQATVTARISGEAFLTEPGALSDRVAAAIRAETGREPALSTTGGTSDARFLSKLAPTVEFGLLNATMHKTDEAVAVADLEALTRIYARVIETVLPQE